MPRCDALQADDAANLPRPTTPEELQAHWLAVLSSPDGADKTAAYQTLYTALTTLTKLLAPVMPFLSETMYQNLKTPMEPESVHLCEFPTADALIVGINSNAAPF